MWTRKRRKAWDKPQPRLMKEGTNMAHNDLQVRPMKIGVHSVACPMSPTGPTRVVRQQPILVVVGCPLHHRSLVPKAAVRTAVPKWSSRQDTRKCTRRPPSNPEGKASKRKVGKVGRHLWHLQWHISDKHQNGSRVATPKGGGSRRLCEVHKQVRKTLRYGGGLGPTECKRSLEEMEIEVKVVDGSYR